MTVDQARYIFKKENPLRMITGIYDYHGDYMFVAPKKEAGSFGDINDPYFIVSSKDGVISGFSPVFDFDWVKDQNKKVYYEEPIF